MADRPRVYRMVDSSRSTPNHTKPDQQASHCDLLFITLNKSEALFSPTTRYRDRALGPSVFHRASQGSVTEPFRRLGFARYRSHGAVGTPPASIG